jgi:hypothetical protein
MYPTLYISVHRTLLHPASLLPVAVLHVLGPLLHPLQDELDLPGLGVAHGQGRQEVRREVDGLVREQAVLVPVVDGAGDEDEGLAGGVGAVEGGGVEGRGVGGGRAPGVLLAVDHGQPRVGDGEAAVLVDGVGVGRRGDVEGVDADDTLVLQGVGAGDERQLVLGYAGSGLEEAPFRADL